MAKPDELLYTAYKTMLLTNLESGFLRQHLSDIDFYALDKYPELFFNILDVYQEKYATGGFVERFYDLNPHRKNDIPFSKEVFKRLVGESDFRAMLKNFNEEVFASDIELMKSVIKDTRIGGAIFHHFGFATLSRNEKLRDAIYDLENFSLTWFNLPAPTDDDLVKSILRKDPVSYKMLSPQQKENKEYVLIAMESSLNYKAGEYATENLYKFIPPFLLKDEDVARILSQGKVVQLPKEALFFDGILDNILNSVYKNPSTRNKERIHLMYLNNLDTGAFEKPRNIEVFLGWMTENKEFMEFEHLNYGSYHKLIKAIAKINPYVKEQFSKQPHETRWHIGNITESKYASNKAFESFFKENIPIIHNEIKNYVMAYELNEQLEKKASKTNKLKI